MDYLVNEHQLKVIIEQSTKKNATYTTGKDNYITKKDGGKIKIPAGTKFTAHYWNDKNLATVDRMEGGKNVPSTTFYCESGKFFNKPANAIGYDKTKVLSNVLWEKVCGQAALDKEFNKTKKTKKYKEYFKDSIYKNAKGEGVPYHQSVDFKGTKEMLKTNGLNVQLPIQTPKNPAHHMNLVAVENIRSLNKLIQFQTGGNYGCMSYGLSSLGNTKSLGTSNNRPGVSGLGGCSKVIPDYSKSTANKLKECGMTMWGKKSVTFDLQNRKQKAGIDYGYEAVFLIDFYFSYNKILSDVELTGNFTNNGIRTAMAPEGWLEFFYSMYGNYTTAYNAIKSKNVTCFQSTGEFKINPHTIFTTLGIASAFIPGVGFVIAAGFGLLDATTYYIEGNAEAGGITTFLTLIPFISKIPAVQSVAKQTFESLAKKILSGGVLSKAEQRALNLVKSNKEKIQREINAYAKLNLKRWQAKLISQSRQWARNVGADANKPQNQLIIDFLESQIRMEGAKQTGVPTKGTTAAKYYTSKLGKIKK